MPEKIRELKMPTGFTRFLVRMPIYLFRAHLGGLLGHRFVLFTHIGRKSGKTRQTVLEVVRYENSTGACIVASGWGPKSDWFLNISTNPKINYQIMNKKTAGDARRLSLEESARELVLYAKNHPAAFKELAGFMGYKLDGSREDIAAMGKLLPMFRFEPEEKSM